MSARRLSGSGTPARGHITPGPTAAWSSVIGTLQRECVYAGARWTSDEERALAIALYLAYYNAERPHIGLGGLPPLEWPRRIGTYVRGDLT